MPGMESTTEEKNLGLEVFFTTTSGVNGRLKKSPEDFRVIERSIEIQPISETELKDRDATLPVYTYAQVTARNWEMNRLLIELKRHLGLSNDKIFFAGTKDKRAITTQLIAFKTTPERVRTLHIDDVKITNIFQATRGFKIGDLIGNDFEINIQDIDLPENEMKEIITETEEQLSELNGFPNFFGVQRFGVIRPVTHEIGKKILQGKFEDAVWMYIGNPMESESKVDYEVRKEFNSSRDFDWALQNYPKHLNFERMLIKYLKDHPDDYIGAIGQFPKNLAIMFIHAYQSYLFNRILSARMKAGLPLTEPIEGDIILPIDEHGLPVHKTWILVTKSNIEKITKQCKAHKAYVSGVLYGNKTEFAQGGFGDLEQKIIEHERINPDDFIIPELPIISSKGNRRELLSPVQEFKFEVTPGCVRMNFGLIKGAYATSLLREYMKTKIKKY